ncbi:MAG: hypothetical protein VX949_00865, partial [Planctomycetota bacterium]|nr:hypothetical protein [Planctomycetota bacterium]
YLIEEVQGVYLSQNVIINDKHIETIVAQMMRNVSVVEPGDSDLLPDTVIDRHRFRKVCEDLVEEGKMPPTAQPMLQGITKAAVNSDSFISAASFQETTKVLTEAALSGKKDTLVGLKENVIMGHMIPAGTGYRRYFDKGVRKLAEPPSVVKETKERVLIGEESPPKKEVSDPLRDFLMGGAAPAPAPEVSGEGLIGESVSADEADTGTILGEGEGADPVADVEVDVPADIPAAEPAPEADIVQDPGEGTEEISEIPAEEAPKSGDEEVE